MRAVHDRGNLVAEPDEEMLQAVEDAQRLRDLDAAAENQNHLDRLVAVSKSANTRTALKTAMADLSPARQAEVLRAAEKCELALQKERDQEIARWPWLA